MLTALAALLLLADPGSAGPAAPEPAALDVDCTPWISRFDHFDEGRAADAAATRDLQRKPRPTDGPVRAGLRIEPGGRFLAYGDSRVIAIAEGGAHLTQDGQGLILKTIDDGCLTRRGGCSGEEQWTYYPNDRTLWIVRHASGLSGATAGWGVRVLACRDHAAP